MQQECTTERPDTVASVELIEMFVSLAGNGGTVSVERLTDRAKVSEGVGLGRSDDRSFVTVLLNGDGGSRMDAVYLDPDECRPVEAIDDAIAALRAAREAFTRTALA